jgi:hypothetical protein
MHALNKVRARVRKFRRCYTGKCPTKNNLASATLLALLGTITGARSHAQSPVVPAVISAQWVTRTFLSLIDPADSGQALWKTTWPLVRARSDFVAALVAVDQDTSLPAFVRGNALMLLGGTGDDRAYQYLVRRLDFTLPDNGFRLNIIIGFGNGGREPPEPVYQRLTSVLQYGRATERRAAAFALGSIRTARAEKLLRSRRAIERSPAVVRMIDRRLTDIKRQ